MQAEGIPAAINDLKAAFENFNNGSPGGIPSRVVEAATEKQCGDDFVLTTAEHDFALAYAEGVAVMRAAFTTDRMELAVGLGKILESAAMGQISGEKLASKLFSVAGANQVYLEFVAGDPANPAHKVDDALFALYLQQQINQG